uniref:Gap junction protein n=1 Tax=Sphenodon punctatus TaxID=8508 RepID=A0A8D0GA63_SPHPU
MGDWNLLGSILEEVHIHSTIVGKIWLTILFIFRMLVLGVAAEDVWDDEQSEFICNTEQPGCSNICYDKAFPISLIRYWVLQVIFVSSPSLVYMGHALYRLRALEKERQRKKANLRAQLEEMEPMLEEHRRMERELRKLEEQKKVSKAPLRGSLLRTYVLHILTRSVVEVGFMIGQYLLYGFQMYPLYKCTRPPCPNTVDCFVSRPTEKTIFMVFMHSIAAVSLFLNILEIIHLVIKKTFHGRHRRELVGAEEEISLFNSKKSSLGQQVCIMTNSSPQSSYKLLPEQQVGLPIYLPPAQGYKVLQPPAEHNQLPMGIGVEQRRQEQHQNPSSSSEETQKQPQPDLDGCPKREQPRNLTHLVRTPMNTSQMEIPQAIRNVLRKQSRLGSCKDYGDDRCDSPDSVHYQGNRKSSFMSRVLSESQLATDSESSDSRNGSGSEAKRRENSSPPITPPPSSAMGRRMSMASRSKTHIYTLFH